MNWAQIKKSVNSDLNTPLNSKIDSQTTSINNSINAQTTTINNNVNTKTNTVLSKFGLTLVEMLSISTSAVNKQYNFDGVIFVGGSGGGSITIGNDYYLPVSKGSIHCLVVPKNTAFKMQSGSTIDTFRCITYKLGGGL